MFFPNIQTTMGYEKSIPLKRKGNLGWEFKISSLGLEI